MDQFKADRQLENKAIESKGAETFSALDKTLNLFPHFSSTVKDFARTLFAESDLPLQSFDRQSVHGVSWDSATHDFIEALARIHDTDPESFAWMSNVDSNRFVENANGDANIMMNNALIIWSGLPNSGEGIVDHLKSRYIVRVQSDLSLVGKVNFGGYSKDSGKVEFGYGDTYIQQAFHYMNTTVKQEMIADLLHTLEDLAAGDSQSYYSKVIRAFNNGSIDFIGTRKGGDESAIMFDVDLNIDSYGFSDFEKGALKRMLHTLCFNLIDRTNKYFQENSNLVVLNNQDYEQFLAQKNLEIGSDFDEDLFREYQNTFRVREPLIKIDEDCSKGLVEMTLEEIVNVDRYAQEYQFIQAGLYSESALAEPNKTAQKYYEKIIRKYSWLNYDTLNAALELVNLSILLQYGRAVTRPKLYEELLFLLESENGRSIGSIQDLKNYLDQEIASVKNTASFITDQHRDPERVNALLNSMKFISPELAQQLFALTVNEEGYEFANPEMVQILQYSSSLMYDPVSGEITLSADTIKEEIQTAESVLIVKTMVKLMNKEGQEMGDAVLKSMAEFGRNLIEREIDRLEELPNKTHTDYWELFLYVQMNNFVRQGRVGADYFLYIRREDFNKFKKLFGGDTTTSQRVWGQMNKLFRALAYTSEHSILLEELTTFENKEVQVIEYIESFPVAITEVARESSLATLPVGAESRNAIDEADKRGDDLLAIEMIIYFGTRLNPNLYTDERPNYFEKRKNPRIDPISIFTSVVEMNTIKNAMLVAMKHNTLVESNDKPPKDGFEKMLRRLEAYLTNNRTAKYVTNLSVQFEQYRHRINSLQVFISHLLRESAQNSNNLGLASGVGDSLKSRLMGRISRITSGDQLIRTGKDGVLIKPRSYEVFLRLSKLTHLFQITQKDMQTGKSRQYNTLYFLSGVKDVNTIIYTLTDDELIQLENNLLDIYDLVEWVIVSLKEFANVSTEYFDHKDVLAMSK